MIGAEAKKLLSFKGWSEDVVLQVGDMVTHAVDRALRQLRSPAPQNATVTLEEGAKYRFNGRLDDSPPADERHFEITKHRDLETDKDLKQPVVIETQHAPEPKRSDDRPLRLLL